MKTLLRMGALALVIALGTGVPAQASPLWILDVPIDVTQLTAGGYAPSSLGVFLQCHIFSAAAPTLEVGYGYVKHVPVSPSGITPVRVVAKPNAHAQDMMSVTYTCYAGVGGIHSDAAFATTNNVESGAITASPLPTKAMPIVLKLVTAATQKAKPPLGAGLTLPSGPVTSPPKGVPPPSGPILSAKIISYGPTTITACPATISYSVRVSSREPNVQFSYVFRFSDNPDVSAPITSFPTGDVVKGDFRDVSVSFQTSKKGTHYVWFQMLSPQSIVLQQFRYDVPCGT